MMNGIQGTRDFQALQLRPDVKDVKKDAAKLVDVGNIAKPQPTGLAKDDTFGVSSGTTTSSNVNTTNMDVDVNVSNTTVNVNNNITIIIDTMPDAKEQMNSISGAISSGNTQAACDQFASFIKDIRGNGMPVDVNALVQEVLRESYLDTTEDLKFYADKVKYFNEAKKMTRQYVQDLRDFKTGLSKAAQEYRSDNFPNGICLSDPPSDGAAKQEFNDFVREYCITHTRAAGHASGDVSNNYDKLVSMINDIAVQQGAAAVVGRCDEKLQSTFGCELPKELNDMITEALTSGDDNKINNAMREYAGYVAYLADAAVAGGVCGGKDDGSHKFYDDYNHIAGAPSWDDYQYCCVNTDVNGGQTTAHNRDRARGNLNPGDIALIKEAFGFPPEVNITGGTGIGEVQDTAMSPLYDAWKNQLLINVNETTANLQNDIFCNGSGSKLGQMYPELALPLIESSAQNSQMANDIGLPTTVPGLNADGSPITTVEELDNAISKFEEKLSTIGDDAQLANTDLQNILQKQQQTLQMMSNISKMLSDTALAVIRKIG